MNLSDMQAKCREGKIAWSSHTATRLLQRSITRADVLNCIQTGEIIEEYPDYWLNSACLVYGMDVEGKVLHVVLGLGDLVHVITAYYPNEKKFMPDLKTRRER